MKPRERFKKFFQRLQPFLWQNRKEKIVLIIISLTLFIGLWHGFPFTNVVADESFFSGAVLRAIDHHSILPLPLDVPYGTITYYVNYISISIMILMLLVLKGFSLLALRLFVIEHSWVIYMVSRLVSYCFALVALFGINHALRSYVEDYRSRLTLVAILFSTMLVNVIFHTSKVWILSTILMLVSFYFLVKAVDINADQEGSRVKKYICYSIIAAFLAFANFPFMGICFLCIPIFYYYKVYKQEGTEYLRTIRISILVGAIVAGLIVLSNFSGIKEQIWSIIYDYTLSPGALKYNASFSFSAFLHLKKIIVMFPILLALIIYAACSGRVRNKRLFSLSLLYLAVYVVALIVVDRWSTVDKAALRYSFPIPFFLAFIVASYDFSFKKILWIPIAVSALYLVPTLYFLSVQTTSYEAVNFVRNNFATSSDVVFINHVGADTELPQNKSSYLLSKPNECGSLCFATIEYDLLEDFKPLVLDAHTDPAKLAIAIKHANVYLVERAASSSASLSLVAKFTNPVEDLNYYSADNTGSYFDPAYFIVTRYGPNIYIYKMIR